jgi:predicted transcriptional regulator
MVAKKAKPAATEQFISLRIPTTLLDELDRIALKQDRPRSYIVRKAIEQYTEQHAAEKTTAR